MCKLIIEQREYITVEFEFDSTVDAAIMVESLRPHVAKETKFIINCIEEIQQEEGENEDGI